MQTAHIISLHIYAISILQGHYKHTHNQKQPNEFPFHLQVKQGSISLAGFQTESLHPNIKGASNNTDQTHSFGS